MQHDGQIAFDHRRGFGRGADEGAFQRAAADYRPEQRLGGLRLRTTEHGPYLSAHSELTAPPWTALRDLENAAWTLQSDTEVSAEKLSESLRLLVAPGSSIGGARPKAGVLDEQGQLWIAKFPGRNDDRDIGVWEQLSEVNDVWRVIFDYLVSLV